MHRQYKVTRKILLHECYVPLTACATRDGTPLLEMPVHVSCLPRGSTGNGHCADHLHRQAGKVATSYSCMIVMHLRMGSVIMHSACVQAMQNACLLLVHS